jgi:hypothetical protein
LQFPYSLDNFAHAEIPIRHHSLDKHNIESLRRQHSPEIFARAAKSVKTSRDIRQRRGLDNSLLFEPAAAKRVPSARHKMIEYGQFARAELPADAQESVRAQPKVKSREVIDGRIDEEQVHRRS